MDRTTLVAMTVLALVAVGCQGAPTEVPVLPTEAPLVAESVPTEVPEEESAPGIPTYSEAGDFCLVVPASWGGRYEKTELTGAEAEIYHSDVTSATQYLHLPVNTAFAPAPLLTIMTMPLASFEAIDPSQSPPPGTLLAQEGDTAWIYAGPQSNPYDSMSPDGLTFDAMYADLGDVSERFNTGPCATGIATGGLPAEVVGTAWQWTGTLMSDGTPYEPADPGAYTVTFAADGSVAVQADCNRAAGTYVATGGALTITMGPMTMAMCPEGSLSDNYVQQLGAVGGWMTSDGQLVLLIKMDSGSMMHRAP